MRRRDMGKYVKRKRPKRDITETSQKVRDVMMEATNMDSRFDPAGSWTGRPVDPYEQPTQDADDL